MRMVKDMNRKESLKIEDYILTQLKNHGEIRNNEVSKQLGVSEVTIRNYLKKLESKGDLKRTHGGAVRKEESLDLIVRPGNVFIKIEEKVRIAKRAYSYIMDKETVFIDDSSIGYYLAKEIKEDDSKHIIVITNSLGVAAELSEAENTILYMTGGQVGGKIPALMGDIAIDNISQFKADKAFVSAYGVNFQVGVTSIGSPQMQIKKAFIENTNEVYLMVDSERFGGGYVMVVCPLSRIRKIITDKNLENKNRLLALEHQVDIDLV